MKKINLNLAALLVMSLLIAGSFIPNSDIEAQTTGVVTVKSKESFDNTVKDIKQLISKNGMMVLSEINQGKILSMTGLSLNARSLFVGNPQLGNKLFSADRGVGIAVPIRLNIYKNTDGSTYVSYVKPTHQLGEFKEESIQKAAKMLDQKFEKLTGMISK